jgi:flagellar protein FliL
MAAEKSRKDKSAMVFIVVALLLTLVGAGTGLTVGSLILSPAEIEAGEKEQLAAIDTPSETEGGKAKKPEGAILATDHEKPDAVHGGDEEAASADEEFVDDDAIDVSALRAVPFPPVLTTLAEPRGKWIRIEGSVLISNNSRESPELLAEKAGEQILAYLRTVRLDQIEGPSGLLGLRDDLNEMVKVLSDGDAKAVLIHGMIVE